MRRSDHYGIAGPTVDLDELAGVIAQQARPLTTDADLDPVMAVIGDARIAMIGEASHGTHEFYHWRARLSQRLIREKGFRFIAVEGDWPDCYRLNRYVQTLRHAGLSAAHVLHAIDRWPTWMWANQDVVDFAEWLRDYNQAIPAIRNVGFFGLDVYSLWDSLQAIIDYLDSIHPEAADRALKAFHCFDPYGGDPQRYARAMMLAPDGCQDEIIDLLVHLNKNARQYRALGSDAFFNAEQNALVARNAERYYRAMIQGGAHAWNVRDLHMMETLNRLLEHHGPQAKAIVWAHNTHIGDARATDMVTEGMVNIGQLAREQYGAAQVALIGFTTHRGHVIAAHGWDRPWYNLPVPIAAAGSWEDVLHLAGPFDKVLPLTQPSPTPAMQTVRGHRAIGVVYHPRFEYQGNYVPTDLPARYDAIIHIDRTHGVRPLHTPERISLEPPETFPYAV